MTDRSWTDEQLSAFIDGELPANEMSALERELELDPNLASRMERLTSAQATYVEAIAQINHMPVSNGLKTAMEAPPASKVVAFKRRNIATYLMEHRAIAASLLCAVAVWGVASTIARDTSPDVFGPQPDGAILASSPLHQMLETAPTGEVHKIGSATAVPRLTFAAGDGSFCRQFDVVSGSGGASAAIACRKEGTWSTQVMAFGIARPTGDFQTAAAVRSPALEAFLDEHMAGAAMNAIEEAERLKRRWVD